MTNPTDTPTGARGPAQLGIQAALLAGDAGLAYRLVSNLMSEGVPFDRVLFDVLAPLQRDVGARWIHADYRIAEEHAATAACETVVSLLAGSLDMTDDGTHVVVACAQGDHHSLPPRMVAAYLAYLGWRVTFLGATLPAADLGAFLADESPAALLLSCSLVPGLVGARACIKAAHAAGVPVIAGGRAFGHDVARAAALGADDWVGDPRTLDGLLDDWTPDITIAEEMALPDADAGALSERIPALVESILADGIDALPMAAARADLTLLGETLAAAILIDDASVLGEFADWHRQRGESLPTEELFGRLAARLPESAARDMLAGA